MRTIMAVVSVALTTVGATGCQKQNLVEPSVGQVERVRAGASVEHGGHVDAVSTLRRLAAGDVVRTDVTGRAVVVLDGGGRYVLDAGASLRVTTSRTATLDGGRLWIAGGGAGGRSDESLLGLGSTTLHVRGARASVTRQGDTLDVTVLAGEIAYETGSERGAVHTGELAHVASGHVAVSTQTLFDDWTGGFADDLPAGNGDVEGVGAVAARRPDEVGAPRWPMVMQRLDAHVVVRGDLAITTVDQTFFNPSADTVEGLYTFHTPEGAVLQMFGVDRHGRTVPGVVRERQQAAAQYQAQVYVGSTHDPALLEWDAPGRYHARLYPIPPGATRRVRVRYAQWLSADGMGHRTYRLPLASIDARIGELRADVDLTDSNATTVRAVEGGRLEGHHLYVAQSDVLAHADLAVELQGAVPPDAIATQAGANGDAHGGFLRVEVRAPQVSARDVQDQGVDLVLVVDHSAATDPLARRLEQAFVESVIRQLDARDQVLVLAGDVTTRPIGTTSAALQPATPQNRQAIIDALSHDALGGATDLGAMIAAAHHALRPDHNGAIVYVGDGRPTVGESDLPALRHMLSRLAPHPRLYAIAVGEEPQLDLLTGLAEPAGFAARVSRRGDVARTAQELVAHASRPLVRNFRVDLGPDVQTVYPADPVDLPAGEPLVVVGRTMGTAPVRVTVRAEWNGGEASRIVPIDTAAVDDGDDLRFRWATLRLQNLLARGESRPVIVELGTRFGLITPFTSLYVPSEDEVSAMDTHARALALRAEREHLSWTDFVPLVGCSREAHAPAQTPVASSASAPSPSVTVATPPMQPAADQPAAMNAAEGAGAAGAAPSRYAIQQPLRAMAPAQPPPPPMAAAAAPTEQAVAPTTGVAGGSDALRRGMGGGAAFGSGGLAVAIVPQGAHGHRAPPGGAPSLAARSRDRNGADDGTVTGDLDGQVPTTQEPQHANVDPHVVPRANAADRAPVVCSDAATVSLAERIPLWRERIAARGGAGQAAELYREARRQCELPAWADRVALLRLLASGVGEVDAQIAMYRGLEGDSAARSWLRAVILRSLARAGLLAHAAELGLGRLDADTVALALGRTATPQERLNVLRELAGRYPDDLELSLRALDAAVEARSAADVRTLTDRLRTSAAADARTRTAVGEALLAMGDEAEARRAFSEIVEFAPDDPVARRRLGDIALSHGWADEAYRQFQMLAAMENDAPDVLLRQAMAAKMAGRLDEAIRLAERVAEQGATGAQGGVAETAAAWIGVELALAAHADGVAPDVLEALRARWRRSPAARAGGAVRVVLRWTHPDDGAELWLALPGEGQRRSDTIADTVFFETTAFADAPASLALEVRRGASVRAHGEADLLVIWGEGTDHERIDRAHLVLDDAHARYVYNATATSLVDVTPPPPSVAPPPATAAAHVIAGGAR